MFLWKKAYRKADREHLETPFLLDRIKSRLTFQPPHRRISDLAFFVGLAIEAVIAVIMVGSGIVLLTQWRVYGEWYIITNLSTGARIQIGRTLFLFGVFLLIASGLSIGWQLKVRRADPKDR